MKPKPPSESHGPLTRREPVSAGLNFSVPRRVAPSGESCNVGRELGWRHTQNYAGASPVLYQRTAREDDKLVIGSCVISGLFHLNCGVSVSLERQGPLAHRRW